MGGVDLADQFVAQNKTDIRTHRWYIRVFGQILDMAVDNALIIMKRDYLSVNKENLAMSVKEFRQKLATQLVPYEENPKTPKSVPPPSGLRYSVGNHWMRLGKRLRCKVCKEKSRSFCQKCEVNLCNPNTERLCFESYHTP